MPVQTWSWWIWMPKRWTPGNALLHIAYLVGLHRIRLSFQSAFLITTTIKLLVLYYFIWITFIIALINVKLSFSIFLIFLQCLLWNLTYKTSKVNWIFVVVTIHALIWHHHNKNEDSFSLFFEEKLRSGTWDFLKVAFRSF